MRDKLFVILVIFILVCVVGAFVYESSLSEDNQTVINETNNNGHCNTVVNNNHDNINNQVIENETHTEEVNESVG